MSVRLNFYASSHRRLQSPFVPSNNPFSLTTRTSHVREFRVWRRRRLKLQNLTRTHLVVCSQLGPIFDDFFHNLISQSPSVNSLDLIAPALGFASGVALYLSRFKSHRNSAVCDVGEWILFTSPTPFNRFVLLRCPSISFGGGELLEDVSEKLVNEDQHFVRLDSGRIQARGPSDGRDGAMEEKLAYQRECVRTDDGGVISLDWPANLDFKEEHGLDTTMLLIPGTAQGSMDEKVRLFVCESLKRGCFPIVMNPRGCARSPLTTARLFTAADSDDICTAIQFINRERPWTTLMSVGWGYGANMLTKYLAEVGEQTPLTAATCIDNPFDLEEAARSSAYHVAVDQKLTGGLIDILRSNKEIFQGRAKGFDVKKALLAKSVRDFEKAISMVSYGFDSIEDFYSTSSTWGVIGNVKIPVLFIQNDDGTVPLFSIPRSSIAENPYTSLLLCSCLPSQDVVNDKSAISWCQNVTIEWLTAVELGLLKGCHPLLKDIDVTVNPSRGLALVEGRKSNKGDRVNKLLDLTKSNAMNGYSVDPIPNMLDKSKTIAETNLRSGQDMPRELRLENKGLQQADNGVLHQLTSSVETESVQEDGIGLSDGERGQVLQTAQVVMNMLDVTMPGTLTEEQKKKVLTAVDQGDTVMKALQDAVPEDVREKLTTAVSGILGQGTNLKNLDVFLSVGGLPNMSSALKSKIQENVSGLSGAEVNSHSSDQRNLKDDLAEVGRQSGGELNSYPSDQGKLKDDLGDGFDDNPPGVSKPAEGPECLPSEKLQNSVNQGQSQSTDTYGVDISSVRKGTDDSGNNHENEELSTAKESQYSDYEENGSETGAKPPFPSSSEKTGVSEATVTNQCKGNSDNVNTQSDIKEENITQRNAEKSTDSSSDQNKTNKSSRAEEAHSSQVSVSDSQPMEMDVNDNQKKEDRNMPQPIPDNKHSLSDSSPPTFSVSEALDALTGMDDSTQVAVNSVFGVIEEMISHIEERDGDNGVKNMNEVKDDKSGSVAEKFDIIYNQKLQRKEDNRNELSLQSDMFHDPSAYSGPEDCIDPQHDMRTRLVEDKLKQNSNWLNGNDIDCFEDHNKASPVGMGENKREEHMVDGEPTPENLGEHVSDIPLGLTKNPFGNSIYNEFLQNHLLSKMLNTKPLDLDTTAALFLDYFPEEGQWKLLEQPGSTGNSIGDITTHRGIDRKVQAHSPAKSNNKDNVIEPLYVILDTEEEQEPIREYETVSQMNGSVGIGDNRSEESICFVKNIILDSLRVEVGRRLSADNLKELDSNLARDLEQVANAVSLAVMHNNDGTWSLEGKGDGAGCILKDAATLNGEHIIKAISFSVQDTMCLRRVLPVGVIVGSSLAALRNNFNVATVHDNSQSEAVTFDKADNYVTKILDHVGEKEVDQAPVDTTDKISGLSSSTNRDKEKAGLNSLNDTVMVGAVTAALGASALLAHQQDLYKGNETCENSSKPFNERGNHQKDLDKLEEVMSERSENNIVTSLAEKAMSVAGPVVPTKEDGEVDQERLVAMLADLGQKGGTLKLVGKLALLWGGLRGAMSLTDRLILFLRIAERPLYQRILGFVCMVLILWSPVVVPLLPTLVQSWTTHNSSRFAQFACVVGLYIAVMILVTLWGKRIRGYGNPLEQYGLDLTSSPKLSVCVCMCECGLEKISACPSTSRQSIHHIVLFL
ncbi:uncharacterized protein LOC131157352 isoform X2 [Malania oleifera]|uniref:uncharacterized protein LOC131157352 isoform X2 n=1 Tax=Malania oleifera TaxID=397392 RepID=UPI0025AE031D|nr:uncharacterized protein LOC131157352 isoform X2 [Malania oleifera]